MAKFYGTIGYVVNIETSPGIWEPDVVEKTYTGDLTKNYAQRINQNAINDSINISNNIEIVADPYATEHFFEMQYVKFTYPKLGGVWKVSGVDATSLPRLVISLGGLYNGKQT